MNFQAMLKAIHAALLPLLFIKDSFSYYIYSNSAGGREAVKVRMSFILSAWEDILSATAWTQQENAVKSS